MSRDTNYGNYEDMYKNYPDYFGDNDVDTYDRPTVRDYVANDLDDIKNDIENFFHDLASDYCDTSEWGAQEYDQWNDVICECL